MVLVAALRTGAAITQASGHVGAFEGSVFERARRAIGIDYLRIDPQGGIGQTPIATAGSFPIRLSASGIIPPIETVITVFKARAKPTTTPRYRLPSKADLGHINPVGVLSLFNRVNQPPAALEIP